MAATKTRNRHEHTEQDHDRRRAAAPPSCREPVDARFDRERQEQRDQQQQEQCREAGPHRTGDDRGDEPEPEDGDGLPHPPRHVLGRRPRLRSSDINAERSDRLHPGGWRPDPRVATPRPGRGPATAPSPAIPAARSSASAPAGTPGSVNEPWHQQRAALPIGLHVESSDDAVAPAGSAARSSRRSASAVACRSRSGSGSRTIARSDHGSTRSGRTGSAAHTR